MTSHVGNTEEFIQICSVKNDSLGLALLAPADLSSYGEHWNAREDTESMWLKALES